MRMRRTNTLPLRRVTAQTCRFSTQFARSRTCWTGVSIALRTHAGLVYFLAGEYGRAIRHLEQLVTLEPGAAFAQYLLAASQLFGGDVLTARSNLRRMLGRDLRPPDECDFNAVQYALAALIFLEARHGDHDAAVRLYHEFASYFPGEYISPASLAVALAGFDRRIEATQKLREARWTSDPRIIFLPLEPYFNELRDDPQFEKTCDEVLSRKIILEEPHFKT
jgi:Flp pilus assembly protein TadD